ncbi:MAG: threonine ammonia-lyase [Candidatus Njordarchaeia archaeon]
MFIDIRNVLLAKKRIGGLIRETPLYKSIHISQELDSDVYLKLENFQITGSFKIRGVANKFLKIKNLSEKRFITVSMGNHAIAVSYASKLLGVESLIVAPKHITWLKKQRIQKLGSNIFIHGDSFDDAEEYARKLAEEKSYEYLSPYNDIDMIEGAATIGMEILTKEPEIETILVPVGGGGLISGIATYAKQISKNVEIIGVQSVASPAMYQSFKSGKLIKADLKPSIAEGLHGNVEDGSITFDFVKKFVDDIVLVDEEEILNAMRSLYISEGLIIEGASAVTLAALYRYKERFRGRKICLVLSGGNIDPEHFSLMLKKSR